MSSSDLSSVATGSGTVGGVLVGSGSLSAEPGPSCLHGGSGYWLHPSCKILVPPSVGSRRQRVRCVAQQLGLPILCPSVSEE